MKNLMQYLSNEEFNEEYAEDAEPAAPEVVEEMELDVPAPVEEVSEEEMEEAEDAIAEDAEITENAEEEAADIEGARDDAEVEVESLEHFTTILRHGLKTKSYSPQFAATAQMKVDELNQVFGIKNSKVSLESFGRDDLEEYYKVSLEALEGLGKRLADLIKNLNDKLIAKVNNKMVIDSKVKAAKAIHTMADEAIASEAKLASPVTVQIKSVEKRLATGEEFGGDIIAALAADQKNVSAIVGSGMSAVTKYVDSVLNIIEDAGTKGGVGKTGDIVAKALALPLPADKFPQTAFSQGLIGGVRLERDSKQGKEGDTRSQIKALAQNAIPVIKGAKFRLSKKTEIQLDQKQVDRLLKTAKVYASMAEKLATEQGPKALEVFKKRLDVLGRHMSGNSTSWKEGGDLGVLVYQVHPLAYRQFDLYFELASHCIDVGQTLVKLAKMAQSAKPKAAEEPAAAAAE